jgi:long-chain acyl-CoA synthetase
MPICHVGERMGNYQSQYSGCDIYYGQNLGTIADDLKEVGPHGFGTVPRVLEKVYDKVMQKANALTGMKKKMFFWALNLGLEYDNKGKGAWYKLQMKLANKLIFSKWREAMGGNIKAIGVGGAALQPRLEKVFWAANIKLLNMYGLTETSPTCTINRMDNIKFGTVGFALPGVEVKIAEDGEILAKGPNIMLGYYKDEKTTSEVLKDGWFATGDIGELDGDGFLRITDRKKSLFKLSNGKYVAPQAIENMFKESEFIDQLMVIGEGQKFTSALISPNWEMLRGWCRENNVNAATLEDAISNKEVVTHFNALVKQINPKLGKDEQLKRVRLVKDEWTPDSGELSPTLKLKRKVIREKYTTVIDEIFGLSSEN